MRYVVKAIYLGFKDLPGYGPHPGVPTYLALLLLSILMGLYKGEIIAGILVGMLIANLIYSPWLLWVAFIRGRDYILHFSAGDD